jgi:mono/diheme cytochrome c family protein/peroxiredoxin
MMVVDRIQADRRSFFGSVGRVMNALTVSRGLTTTGIALGICFALSVAGGLATLSGDDKASPDAPVIAALPTNFRVQDLDGRQMVPGGSPDCKGVAIIFLSTECPLCNSALPQLNKQAALSRKQGVELFGVISDRSVTRQQAQEHSAKFHIKFPMILDSVGTLRELTGATHTPEAFVFDQSGKQVYRGLLDDSSERPGKKNVAKKYYLGDALRAVASGHRVAVARTQAVGCLLEKPGAGGTEGAVTFNRDIAPIVFANCVTCHRDGEVAPFPLTNYEQVSKRAKQVAEVVTSRIMPPWRPVPNYGHFSGERRLSDAQIALVSDWAKLDAPEGEAADLPPLPKFPKGWQLGKPDKIVKMVRPFALPAGGPDLYQHFVIPLGMNRDRLVKAIEVHPGNPKVVHHAHMYLDHTGQARILDQDDPKDGYTRFGGHGLSSATYLGGWNPGATPHFFPPGTGRLMPTGGDVVFQIHYHPSGKPEFDQTEIGIYYAAADAQQLITDLIVGNTDLMIPAGAADARFTGEYTTPSNLLLMEIRPHMHLLGKSYQVRGILPSGAEIPLIKIDDWDFNWQDSYIFDPVVRVPAGTKIRIEVAFDNSANNPANPHSPPQTVYFGEESTDEMSNCAIRVTSDNYAELQQVISDNARYWSGEMRKYLDREMTPDKKFREQRTPKNSRKGN